MEFDTEAESEAFEGEAFEGEAFEGEAFEGEAFEGEAFEGEAFEGEAFEFDPEGAWGEVFGETEVQELAAELLAVNSEQELNQFLGDLMKKAARALGSVVHSPVGQALGSALKSVGKHALPVAGAALGNMIVPGLGGMIGGKLASGAGSLFGLELEGLSNEEGEFEVAKAFVRLGADATKQAIEAAEQGNSVHAAVKSAIGGAAERFAPGLLQLGDHHGLHPHHHVCGGAQPEGRWIRRGNQIVLLGL